MANEITTAAPAAASGAVLTKTADKTGALPGDTINYTLTFTNQSSTDYPTVEISDALPSGLTLVAGSVNPAPAQGEALGTGINVGPVAAGGTAAVTFSATVNSGASAPAENQATADYTYTDNGQTVRGVTFSNLATVQIPAVTPTFQKTVTPSTVQPGGLLHYTLTFTNTASVPLNQVVLTDTSLPSSLTVQNLQLNGAAVPSGQTLSTGIQAGTLAANGGTATVTFDAVAGPNTTNPITNTAAANYSYTSGGSTYTGQSASNTATASLAQSSLSVTKTANKAIVNACGDTVTYTVTVTNTGNVPLDNVTVTDQLPQGMEYLENSTIVGSGAAANQNPQDGIPVGTLAAGQSAAVQFSVTVNCL